MILLALDSLLLLYITAGAGICMVTILQKIFKQPIYANSAGVIIAGLILCTVYFNLLSFWLPVNYISLSPLLMLSSLVFYKNGTLCATFTAAIKKQVFFLMQRHNLPVTITIAILLLYCWLLPPVNADSPGYHYATILWFEKYRVVPGLANINGWLAYNCSAFIIQAPYVFTSITGQSLYPLNGVLVSLLFLWMVTRALRNASSIAGLVYFGLLYLLNRVLLCNMSSPTADILVIFCLAYAFIHVFDALLAKKTTATYFLLPAFIILYAVTAKLSAFPALLLLPFILWLISKKQRVFPMLTKLFLLSLPIYIPWLCRNVILSGYLFYPVPNIDIFKFDWKAPKSVLLFDYTNIKRLPINFSNGLMPKPAPFPYWVMPWVHRQIAWGMYSNLAILIAAALSPFYWLIAKAKTIPLLRPAIICWLILYTCVWLWLVNVPEYRFGIIFLSFTIVSPILYVAIMHVKKYKALPVILAALFITKAAWDVYHAPGINNIYAFSLKKFVLLPLKDKAYYFNNNKADFPYTMLNNGVKLYHQDTAHACINADLPCMTWQYGTIEMRGNHIAEGFRNVQDDMDKNYKYDK